MKFIYFFPLLLPIATIVLARGSNCGTLVRTGFGTVRGRHHRSRYGRLFASFRGIPYAKPPVGQLRFKEPQPLQPPVNFHVDATKEGPYCIQKNYFASSAPKIEGQEDCLYLNVYVPQVYGNFPLPVMVFIHWGGFVAGRGTSDFLGPDYFMDQDVVLVTFNYRLGVLGFLSTLDDESPGNYGLKDQVAVLRWVQDYIESFGGDRGRVTIFGQSAGAGSVHYHILSPQSKGLFHRAISQSGSALALWAKPFNDLQMGATMAEAQFVGCANFSDHSQLMECLRNVPAAVLIEALDNFKIIGMDPVTVFATVIETETARNPRPFLAKQPLDHVRSGDFQKVPWIAGLVRDEGILRVASLARQPQQLGKFNADYEKLFPEMLLLSASVPKPRDLLRDITQKYLMGRGSVDPGDPASIQGLIDVYTDRSMAYGTYQSVMLHSAVGHGPIWFYNFEYRGEYTYGDYFAGTNRTVDFNWGVSHCDDLLYLFNSPGIVPPIVDPTSQTMIDLMVGFWTTFATYGTPVLPGIDSVQWDPVDITSKEEMKNENLRGLNIGGSAREGQIFLDLLCGYRRERMKFWSSRDLFENFDGLD